MTSHLIKDASNNRAVFFDRDGTLNVNYGYVHQWEQFSWVEGAPEAIKLCNDLGYLVFVVTNQAGVAKGHFEESAVRILHKRIRENLDSIGAHIDRFECCPHHVEAIKEQYRIDCPRRKPNPGMVISCLDFWKLKPENCFLVGDKDTDIQAAKAANIRGYLFEGWNLLNFLKKTLSSQNINQHHTAS